jgi:hypothetical protein
MNLKTNMTPSEIIIVIAVVVVFTIGLVVYDLVVNGKSR